MVSTIASYAIGCLQLLLAFFFYTTFLEWNTKRKLHTVVYILAICGLWQYANSFQIPCLNIIISLSVFLGLAIISFCGSTVIRTVLSLLIAIVFLACDIITGYLLSLVPGVAGANVQLTALQIIAQLIILLMALFIVWLIRLVFLHRKNRNITPYANYSSLLLLAATILFAFYIGYVEKIGLPGSTPSVFSVSCLVFMLVVDAVIIIGNEFDQRRYLMENEISSMRQQEDNMALLIATQAQQMNRLAEQSHDYKNHFQTILDLLGSSEEAEFRKATTSYIEDMLQTMDTVSQFSKVKNNALRVILDRVKATCDTSRISFEAKIAYSEFAFLSFKDICTLFMNALNNAIEACQQQEDNLEAKLIVLGIHRQNSMVFIKIENTKNNQIHETSNGIISSKKDDDIHGIGMKNMQRIASKYGGELLYEYNEDVFSLLITLQDIGR